MPRALCEQRQARADLGVGVDQTSGQVYVFGGFSSHEIEQDGGGYEVVVYTADAGEEVTRFGELDLEARTIAETPEKMHSSNLSSSRLAVDSATGDVYVYDEVARGLFYNRLMVFGPHEGDRSEYEYLGEVLAGEGEERNSRAPVLDDAGHLYVAGIQETGDHIEEFAPQTPASYPAPEATPLCSFHYEKGGLEAMTVDPETGEPFFYSYKRETKAHWLRRLSACDEGSGEFTETAKMAIAPERGDIFALAFDPERRAEPSREKGILYGAANEPTPESGEGEPTQSALGYIFGAPTAEPHPPAVEAESFAHVTATSALLRATVDPEGYATRYAFQYETQAAYEANPPEERFAGASEAPAGGAPAGEGSAAIALSTQVAGLSPGTEYRFRVVVSNHGCPAEPEELCGAVGEALAFRTFPSLAPGLPDGRAYELVSPQQKNGGQVLPADPSVSSCGETACKPGTSYQHFPMQSAPDGNAVLYEGTNFGLGGPARENAYVAHRDPSTGWQSTDPTPSLLESGGGYGYKAFSADFGAAVLEQPANFSPLASGAPAGYAELYAQSTEPLALAPLAPTPPHRSVGEFKLRFAAASADGQRVFFAANDALSGGTPYAPAAEDGGGAKFNLYEWHAGQLSLVNVMPGNAETHPGASFATASANTVSADGRRAFFSDESGQVYVREDARRTREIPDGGKFLSASRDGSKVLLGDGFLYDLETNTGVDLSEGKGGFEGALGQSEGLSRLYFVDGEVLDEAPNEAGEEAEAGKNNLYAWGEGEGTRFVAQLAAEDNTGGGGFVAGFVADWNPVPAERTAEASPGGRYLAFLSVKRLTGYDNSGPCGYVEAPCPEAFVYDSASGRLACASCNPSGTAPLGWTVLRRIQYGSFAPQPRYLSDSGRLYFDSRDSLVPADTNEGREDVYQWEPQGVGGCASGFAEGGCVALISAGREGEDSNLVAVDETGANVFFTTRDRLVAKDTDELIDLYDAREGGGIAAETETQRSECQGESCQPSPNPPSEVTPASAAFAGAGNLAQGNPSKPRCPKGRKQVKRKGRTRCVAKHAKRHHRKHKRHHKRRRRGANANRRAGR